MMMDFFFEFAFMGVLCLLCSFFFLLSCMVTDNLPPSPMVEEDEDDDEWEGIERSDLERRFGSAVTFVGSRDNADLIRGLQGDVRVKLYGLHKIVTEGQCWKPQPLSFRLSACAKWNAWRLLGNMNPEVAMEEYVKLLSESIPDWDQIHHRHC